MRGISLRMSPPKEELKDKVKVMATRRQREGGEGRPIILKRLQTKHRLTLSLCHPSQSLAPQSPLTKSPLAPPHLAPPLLAHPPLAHPPLVPPPLAQSLLP